MHGSGADVRWPADAEQRGENRLADFVDAMAGLVTAVFIVLTVTS